MRSSPSFFSHHCLLAIGASLASSFDLFLVPAAPSGTPRWQHAPPPPSSCRIASATPPRAFLLPQPVGCCSSCSLANASSLGLLGILLLLAGSSRRAPPRASSSPPRLRFRWSSASPNASALSLFLLSPRFLAGSLRAVLLPSRPLSLLAWRG